MSTRPSGSLTVCVRFTRRSGGGAGSVGATGPFVASVGAARFPCRPHSEGTI